MKRFADLLQSLVLTPSRNRKIEILRNYFTEVPDPDRGYALGVITGDLKLNSVKPSFLRQIMETRMDHVLFRLSYDYVGDMAETIALLWDQASTTSPASKPPHLPDVIHRLETAGKTEKERVLTGLMNDLGPSERYALLKIATGGLRIGVSSRLVKQALASHGNVPVTEIEEIWHGLGVPYEDLFRWLEGKSPKPVSSVPAPFRPVMLSHALEKRDHQMITPDMFAAEWKWDGIRIQAVNDRGSKRLYSRTGDDISGAFPDIVDALTVEGTYDGELLVRSPMGDIPKIETFSALQQRLNRKTVSRALLASHPGFVRLYDVLISGSRDLRPEPLIVRRKVLTEQMQLFDPDRFDLSPSLEFSSFQDLEKLRVNPPSGTIEGLMLKRLDSPYLSGRPRGMWFKWKHDPKLVDAVLMYAQRGHGKRSGFYSDFTFGCWKMSNGEMQLLPVGKAYFGFTDEELKQLDKYVRDNTLERFGPVRSVVANRNKGLVLEIAFEGLNRSKRHKSGVAMRFPRIARIRWDKPPSEADTLDTLEAMLD